MKEHSIEISPAAERDFKDLKNNLKNFKDLVNTIDENYQQIQDLMESEK